jgi:hypothetical protein
MFALLAPRISLTIGPYTSEASKLIASHLAVLTRTDSDRHFLQTVYPSEPILAEASARLIYDSGWAGPLSALVHYVRSGIVEAGFKGELMTKIVCLMAMDKALGRKAVRSDRWRFSQPITVSEFLNHLIVPLQPNHTTFCQGLKGVQERTVQPTTLDVDDQPKTLNIDDKKFQRFLGGYVFFNHFIRVDVKLSYSMLVHAWNRGAAIMCMTNTKGIDHVIPVMLDTESNVMFSPLHGCWKKEHSQQARPHISYILINSKNYASGKDQTLAAWATKFSAPNLTDYGDSFHSSQAIPETDPSECDDNATPQKDFDLKSQYIDHDPPDKADGEKMKGVEMTESDTDSDNVFLSLIQDFGKKRLKEPWVQVGQILRTHRKLRKTHPPAPPVRTQFFVILKGIGINTYQCLKDDLHDSELQRRTRTYLQELRSARVDYVDTTEMKCTAAMQNIPLVYGDSMLGSEKWVKYRSEVEDRRRA